MLDLVTHCTQWWDWYLHVVGPAGDVVPRLWRVAELVGVDDTQHQHGVDDDHPPEDMARDTPPAITQL